MTDVDVRALRARLGWSQVDMARFLGMSESSLQRWESGTCKPTGAVSELLNAINLASRNDANAAHLKELAANGETFRTLLRKFFIQALGGT